MATGEQLIFQLLQQQPQNWETVFLLLGLAGLFIGYKIVKGFMQLLYKIAKVVLPFAMAIYILVVEMFGKGIL